MLDNKGLTNGTKNIIAASIIAIGLMVSAYLYALANRYEIDKNYPYERFDKWKNTYELMKEKK